MAYEHTCYCCEFCDQEFDSKRHAESHEEDCDDNPANKLEEEIEKE